MWSKKAILRPLGSTQSQLEQLKKALETASVIVIGAGGHLLPQQVFPIRGNASKRILAILKLFMRRICRLMNMRIQKIGMFWTLCLPNTRVILIRRFIQNGEFNEAYCKQPHKSGCSTVGSSRCGLRNQKC